MFFYVFYILPHLEVCFFHHSVKMKSFAAELERLFKEREEFHRISLVFNHIRPGLEATLSTFKQDDVLVFNQPINRVEENRIIHAIKKRMKRYNHREKKPNNIKRENCNRLLGHLSFDCINNHNLVRMGEKQITYHMTVYYEPDHNDATCNMNGEDTSGCFMMLRAKVPPNHKVQRLLSRMWSREQKKKNQHEEIGETTELAETTYDLHRQNPAMFSLSCPTIESKVAYIVGLIELYNAFHFPPWEYKHPLPPIICFYVKLLDKEIEHLSTSLCRQLLAPFKNATLTNCKSVNLTLQYLFTTADMNNEAPHVQAAMHTRCSRGRQVCENCNDFWHNTSMCARPGNCPRAYHDVSRCFCPDTEERPGTEKLCANWSYQQPDSPHPQQQILPGNADEEDIDYFDDMMGYAGRM